MNSLTLRACQGVGSRWLLTQAISIHLCLSNPLWRINAELSCTKNYSDNEHFLVKYSPGSVGRLASISRDAVLPQTEYLVTYSRRSLGGRLHNRDPDAGD